MIRTLRSVWAVLGPRERALAFFSAALRWLELLVLFAAAFLASRGEVIGGLTVAAFTACVAVGHGVLGAHLTERARRPLFDALCGSLLEADVLEDGTQHGHEAEPLVFRALFESIRLYGSTLPALLGELAASAMLGGFIVVALPAKVAAAVSIASLAALTVLLTSHRAMRATVEREGEAFQAVADGLVCAFRGRLEIVASGRDAEFLETQRERTIAWSHRARAAVMRAAITGRAPLTLAGLTAAFILVGPSLLRRDHWNAAEVGSILVVASAAPAFAAALRDGLETLRASKHLEALMAILHARRGPTGAGPTGATPSLPATIQVEKVWFSYADGASPVLKELDFEWNPKDLLVLSGPNGSGKSTVLRLLLGLLRPTRGRIAVGGTDLHDMDLKAWRRCVSFVPQRPFWPENLTIRDIFHLTVPAAEDDTIEKALRGAMVFEALASRARTSPLDLAGSTLSAGERQRVILARAIAADAPIILLDEPDTNLDAPGVEWLLELARSRVGRAMAIVAHAPSLIATGDRVIALSRQPGRATESGPAPAPQTQDRSESKEA